ncbi:MAG: RNA polymerase sigma factor [Verrucomicrobia bacterium]|nr:RNA polymerase sigma factor [Verrucomicrobiota bacterium]
MPPENTEQSRWFAEEVHAHDLQLKAYLRGSFPAVRDVDDVVQESYLRIWKARAAQPIRSAKAFLFTVARRLALDHLRSQRRSPIIAVTDLSHLFVLESAPNAREATATSEEITLLVEVVDSLPARCREIFILRRLQGVPQKDIAARLGLSEQTVQVQAARGVRRCTEFIHRRLKQP